jgi:hypothetical protein
MHELTRRSVRRLLGLVALALALLLLSAPVTSAAVAPGPFRGSASAMGMQVETVLPGGIATDEPLDSGGPTGQAALDSVGDTSGYAASPDPGAFVVSLPGLGAGALAGTPASSLPAPGYPLEVTASGTDPSVHAGTGPEVLDATANPDAATGSADDIVVVPDVGQVAVASGHASVTVRADGSVVATATSTVQGLTIGPVDLGDVTSTATETLSPSGRITPKTSITVVGARIGPVPLTISPGDANNPAIQSALAADHLTLSFAAAQQFPGEVVAPALVVSGPLQTTPATVAPSDFTIALGSAIATMSASAALGSTSSGGAGTFGSNGSTSSPAASGSSVTSASTPVTANPASVSGPTPTLAGAASAQAPAPDTAGGSAPGRPAGTALAGEQGALTGLFDIRSLYLVVVAIGLAALVATQLVRWIGVRGPWASSSG